MAAPNLGSASSSVFLRVTTGPVATTTGTNASLIVSCGDTSSTVLRVTRLDINNIDGVNACDISVLRFVGTNSTTIVNTVSVPADAVLRVYDDYASLAVTEGQDIRAIASASGDLTFDAEYQEFS